MDEYLVSQREAVRMLRETGLSRRAAYGRLERVPFRTILDAKAYSRIDVEILCDRITVVGDAS
jgi:hypothetical protein